MDPRRVWVVKKLTTKHFSVDGRRFQMATGWDELKADTMLDAITVKNGIATVSLLEFVTKAFDAKDMQSGSLVCDSEIDSQKTLGLGVRGRDAAGISPVRGTSPTLSLKFGSVASSRLSSIRLDLDKNLKLNSVAKLTENRKNTFPTMPRVNAFSGNRRQDSSIPRSNVSPSRKSGSGIVSGLGVRQLLLKNSAVMNISPRSSIKAKPANF